MSTSTLSVVLVDDSRSYLDAATSLLELEGARVLATASTADEAVSRVRECRPDVVLVDVHLGEASGLDVVRRLAEDGSTAPVIMVSTAPRDDVEPLLIGTTAAGFVPKERLDTVAIRAILDTCSSATSRR